MRRSFGRPRESFLRMPVDGDVGSQRFPDELPPRLSFRHSQCGSPRASSVSSFDSLAEIEKHTAEIESLLASDDEIAGDFGGLPPEKHVELSSVLARRLTRIRTQTSLPSLGSRTTFANALDIETEENLDNAVKMAILLGSNMEMDHSGSRGSVRARYEYEIKKLRKQLEIEHGISASFKLKLQEKQSLVELLKKELEEVKMEKERTTSEVIELQKELDMKISEIEELKEELNRKHANGIDNFLESMKASIEIFQKENVKNKDKEMMDGESLQSKIDGTLEKEGEDIRELVCFLKQIVGHKELDKSYEEEKCSKIIDGLQADYECQKENLLKLVETLKEELRTMTRMEFLKTNQIIIGLDGKLVDCINILKEDGDVLLNLKAAISQFHAEHKEKERLEKDIASAREELVMTSQLLKTANLELEISKKENQDIDSKLSHSERMLLESTDKIQELEEDNSKLHRALEHSMKKINNMATDSENYIDRRIIAKLLITYFQRNNSQEVLDLMMRFLGLSEDDKKEIVIAQQGGDRAGVHSILNITSRFVGGVLGSQSPDLSPKELRQSQSIADLWVDFLLKDVEQREKRENTEAQNLRSNSNITVSTPKQGRAC